jgi:hypothetical protein
MYVVCNFSESVLILQFVIKRLNQHVNKQKKVFVVVVVVVSVATGASVVVIKPIACPSFLTFELFGLIKTDLSPRQI